MKELEEKYLKLDDDLNYLSARKSKIDTEMLIVKSEMLKVKDKILTAYEVDGECPINLTVANVAPCPVITDESLLPERFIRTKSEVNKQAINKAIRGGEQIEGVSMGNGSVTIKIKQRGK